MGILRINMIMPLYLHIFFESSGHPLDPKPYRTSGLIALIGVYIP